MHKCASLYQWTNRKGYLLYTFRFKYLITIHIRIGNMRHNQDKKATIFRKLSQFVGYHVPPYNFEWTIKYAEVNIVFYGNLLTEDKEYHMPT